MIETIPAHPGAPASERSRQARRFPVGFYHLHDDVSLNFQANRWLQWMDASAVDEMRPVMSRIHNYADWIREFMTLGERALASGQRLNAAFSFRSAEFFMPPDDPAKLPTRERFVSLAREHFGIRDADRHLIPYVGGQLPAYRFTPPAPRGTILLFGGFDSYIEEFFAVIFALRDQGYDVVAFEGPGQGGALEDAGLPMTVAWEKPVGAVLDHFGLDEVTLIGISLGGGLAIRGAIDPRVRRAVAWDVLSDFFEANLRQVNAAAEPFLRILLRMRARPVIDAIASQVMARSYVARWGIRQGMHVLGVATSYDYLRKVAELTTYRVSPRVTADVLLLAGNRDHYVPLEQLYR